VWTNTVWTLADAGPARSPSGRNQGSVLVVGLSWMVRGWPIRSVPAQVRRVFRTQRARAGVVRPGLGSAKRAAQQTSLPPEGTPVQTSPSGRHRAGEERTPGVPRNAEPTSRRTVKSEGRGPLYGRRRLLAWPQDGHPSSIRADSTGCRSERDARSNGRAGPPGPVPRSAVTAHTSRHHRGGSGPGTGGRVGPWRAGEHHPPVADSVGWAQPGSVSTATSPLPCPPNARS